jgi:sodium transport system permease protein
MNWKNVKLIFLREFRDQLRDRRTLFVIIILPLLLYPLIGMTFLQVSQFLQQHPSRVLFLSRSDLAVSPPLIEKGQLARELKADGLIDVEIRLINTDHIDEIRKTALKEIDDDAQDAVVYFPPEFIRQFADTEGEGKSARLGDADTVSPLKLAEPQIYVNTARDRCRLAHDRVNAALMQWRSRIVDATLARHRVPARAITPFTVVTEDVAEPSVRRAALWSKVLPFVILLWTMTGAFYPAIDLCAGEKERGTLETLLSSPAERIEIVWGKLLTVMTFSCATALLNLICVSMTAAFVFSQFDRQLANSPTLEFGPPPLASVLWIIPMLIPLSALFGALSLALATMARSSKEGQYYLMPVLLVTMPLVTLPMLPSAKLDLGSSLIPLTGLVLLVRQLMEGEYREVLLHAVPVFVVTAGCCWFAIRWAVDQFNNETVLFRESERFSLGTWLVQIVRDRNATPSVVEGVMCGLLILLIRFFGGLNVGSPTDWPEFVVVVAVSALAFVATPALVMSVILTTSPKQTLLLRVPRWPAIPMAILLAVFLHPLALTFGAIVRHLYPVDERAFAGLEDIISEAPILQLLLVFAVLPAICEEVAFRGFILSGLRHLGSRWRAIIISSIFFGLAHFAIQQSLVAGMFGLVIGYIAVQTGSLLPCIAFHMVHNGLTLLSAFWMPIADESWPAADWIFREPVASGDSVTYLYTWPLVIVAGILSVLALRWFRFQPPQPSLEERYHDSLDHQTSTVGMVAR